MTKKINKSKIKTDAQVKKEIRQSVKTESKTSDKITLQGTGLNQKVIAQKNYIDPETGETLEANFIRKDVYGDKGFYKIWLADILGLLDDAARGKMKIILYMLERIRSNNIILAGTVSEIAKGSHSSLTTVYETIDYLHERDVIRTIQRGVYQVNANLIFKGNHNARKLLVIEYNKLNDQAPIPIDDIQNKERETRIKK